MNILTASSTLARMEELAGTSRGDASANSRHLSAGTPPEVSGTVSDRATSSNFAGRVTAIRVGA